MHHPRLPLSKKKIAKLKLQRQQREQHREQEREQRERRERRDMAAEDERGAIMEENIGIGKRLKTQFDDGKYYTGTIRNLKRRKDGQIIKIYIVYDDGNKTEVCDWPDESVILLENNMIVNHDRCNEVQELRNVEEIARISEDSLVGAIERFRSRTDSEFFPREYGNRNWILQRRTRKVFFRRKSMVCTRFLSLGIHTYGTEISMPLLTSLIFTKVFFSVVWYLGNFEKKLILRTTPNITHTQNE
jgi:hypothetical protein